MYHKMGSSAYKEGLENIEVLSSITGHPEKKLRCIHVAGTNGKGSVTHLLSSFYQEMGYKVGLYTSPHLVDFRERIKINGEMIPKEKVVEFFEKHQRYFQLVEPSFFEMTTALAFYYFAEEKVDIAIIEVGLGGRLDATNIITPDISVITNISLDHTQLLGNTRTKIALEKAGIIKHGVPVVIGQSDPETLPIFRNVATLREAPLYSTEDITVSELPSSAPFTRCINISHLDTILCPEVSLPLTGDYQFENVATAVKTLLLHQQENPYVTEIIRRGIENVLKNTHLRGRWEILCESPLTICDTGHNSGGFTFLSQQLDSLPCRQLHCIIGFVNDKDIDSIIHLLPRKAHYTVCKASVARAEEPERIVAKMTAYGLQAEASKQPVYATYQALKEAVQPNDAIYVGGSTFIVADLLAGMDKSL
ncbi:MAG: bifunctional folylpolyglutamate synthase/dihydrofolate synthase [Bacteroidales bacterium]|nr:bifunctional folylpolyglutamate synthase/dihydrofolate synthase [Bacteroidales bacterium]